MAHCVDFNIMSQDDSPLHALGMVREALGLAFADDLNRGLDPADRRADVAAEDWEPLLQIMKRHRSKVLVRDMDASKSEYEAFAMQTTIVMERRGGGGLSANTELDVDGPTLLAA